MRQTRDLARVGWRGLAAGKGGTAHWHDKEFCGPAVAALVGSLATRQAELRLELSKARPRYAAAVAKVKKLQADFEATLSELHFRGKRANLMGAINAL